MINSNNLFVATSQIPCCSVLLADEHVLLPNLEFLFVFVSWTNASRLQAKYCLVLQFPQSSLYRLYPGWKSCTLDLDSRGPRPSSERLTSFASVPYLLAFASSHPRTSSMDSRMFHHLGRTASILVLHDVLSPSWNRNLELSFAPCRLLRYHQHHHHHIACWKFSSAGGDGPGRTRSFTSSFEHGNTSKSCANISLCLNLCRSSIYTLVSVKKPCT